MIRIFIGCAPNHEDAESQAVLEWSIRKRASRPVHITWMKLSNDPESPGHGWRTEKWATPFSGFRWAVPELAGFTGKAIYLDSDFIFMADVAELYDQEIPAGKVVLGKGGGAWRLCCSLWDCAAARPHMMSLNDLKNDPDSHQKMRHPFRSDSPLIHSFQGDWNCLDGRGGERLEDVKALHYTRMSTQPQLEYAIPRLKAAGIRHWYDGSTSPHPRADVRKLFKDLLHEAEQNGYTVESYCQDPPFGPLNKRSFKGR